MIKVFPNGFFSIIRDKSFSMLTGRNQHTLTITKYNLLGTAAVTAAATAAVTALQILRPETPAVVLGDIVWHLNQIGSSPSLLVQANPRYPFFTQLKAHSHKYYMRETNKQEKLAFISLSRLILTQTKHTQ